MEWEHVLNMFYGCLGGILQVLQFNVRSAGDLLVCVCVCVWDLSTCIPSTIVHVTCLDVADVWLEY